MRTVSILVLVAALAGLAPGASAQPAPADTSETVVYGSALTLRAMLLENRALRPLPQDPTQNLGTDPFLGIGRLVVDETISRTGSYFYDVFYQRWNPPSDARFVSVVLSEQPLPGQGTLVSVRLDGELVFQSRLTPREEAAEELADQAIAFTLRRLPRGDG